MRERLSYVWIDDWINSGSVSIKLVVSGDG